jgi:hypothetical protein
MLSADMVTRHQQNRTTRTEGSSQGRFGDVSSCSSYCSCDVRGRRNGVVVTHALLLIYETNAERRKNMSCMNTIDMTKHNLTHSTLLPIMSRF